METKLLSGNITLHFLLCNYLTRTNLKFVVNLNHGQGLRISYRLFQMRFDLENEKKKKKKQKGKQKEKEKRRGMVKCLRLTDKEKSKTFLISSGCVTVPMVLISRTLSSCKSAFLNSFIMASSEVASPFLRTVL